MAKNNKNEKEYITKKTEKGTVLYKRDKLGHLVEAFEE